MNCIKCLTEMELTILKSTLSEKHEGYVCPKCGASVTITWKWS